MQDWLRSSAKSPSDKIMKERLKGCSLVARLESLPKYGLSGRELLRLFLRLADQLISTRLAHERIIVNNILNLPRAFRE